MLMKFESGDPWEDSFAEYIAGQVQHNRIAGPARNILRDGFEMKLGDIHSAQQTFREFSLVLQLFAAFKRQRRARLFLRRRKSQRARERRRKTDRLCEKMPAGISIRHLK
jgi:hypothetical protein